LGVAALGVVVLGAVSVAGVCGGGAGLVLGSGVCGTPEPGLGVAGLSCAQPNAAHSNTKQKTAIGERCIESYETPVFNPSLDAQSSYSDGRPPAQFRPPNLRDKSAIQKTSRASALPLYV
jgi:hypothetical protein